VFQDLTVPADPGSPAGPGLFVGSASGTLTASPQDGTAVIVFDTPLSFELPSAGQNFPPGVIYTVDGPRQTIQFNLAGLGAVRGAVAEAVPLPGVAMAGITLLGGVGGLRRLRGRAAEQQLA